MGEFDSVEYDDYWITRSPIQVGMRSSLFCITRSGRSPLCPLINRDSVGSSHDGGDSESNPKRPKTKRGPKRE